MTYIATFYSHFGAVRFKRSCEAAGVPARLMPVPRSLSSSCGTCVSYEGAGPRLDLLRPDEAEQVVEAAETGYRTLYRAAEDGAEGGAAPWRQP